MGFVKKGNIEESEVKPSKKRQRTNDSEGMCCYHIIAINLNFLDDDCDGVVCNQTIQMLMN